MVDKLARKLSEIKKNYNVEGNMIMTGEIELDKILKNLIRMSIQG